MKVQWALLCSTSLIDKERNNLSLINVVEQITLAAQGSEFGAWARMQPPMQLVSLWRRNEAELPERGKQRVLVVAPNGEIPERVTPPPEIDVDLDRFRRYRIRTAVTHFPVCGPGTYEFRIEKRTDNGEWEPAGSVPLDVRYATSEETPEASPE